MEFIGILLIYLAIPVFIYWVILAVAPKKTKRDEKIVVVLGGILAAPMLIDLLPSVTSIVIGLVWIVVVYLTFTEKTITRGVRVGIGVFIVLGVIVGRYIAI